MKGLEARKAEGAFSGGRFLVQRGRGSPEEASKR